MEKTIEYMRTAVLAECEAVCPSRLYAPIECGHLAFGYVEDDGVQMEAWFLYVGAATAPMSLYALAGEQVWLAAYYLLGLDKRDALEAERGKSAKLVEAFEEIKKPWYIFNLGKRASLKNTLEQYKTRCMAIQDIVSRALEAYKEGKKDGN